MIRTALVFFMLNCFLLSHLNDALYVNNKSDDDHDHDLPEPEYFLEEIFYKYTNKSNSSTITKEGSLKNQKF